MVTCYYAMMHVSYIMAMFAPACLAEVPDLMQHARAGMTLSGAPTGAPAICTHPLLTM
jgi:hypothetical protein